MWFKSKTDIETQRLLESHQRTKNWQRWGPYLAERQWSTVREDYSADGSCWEYLPHDHARSRAYRWGEDGLLGICDRECRLCFALALWNERDPILKERLFGLTANEGNHGEDVKEYYFYLDSTPTHSYMKALYKYPQLEFPYTRLVEENRCRGKQAPEFELLDTGVFDGDRYFDVVAEYAKASPDDILIRITLFNRGPEPARLHLLPTLWFRNSWSWGRTGEDYWAKPTIAPLGDSSLVASHASLGDFMLAVEPLSGQDFPGFLFTDNETNFRRLFGLQNSSPHVKDAFHEFLIQGKSGAVNPDRVGTKAAALYRFEIPARGQVTLRLRLFSKAETPSTPFGGGFDRVFEERIEEADQFFESKIPGQLSEQERRVARQAYAGLLWSKQFYNYVVAHWLEGDPSGPQPQSSRLAGRNHDWVHLYNRDVISVPDKWEFPWYAAWDLAFHMVSFAKLDPAFAKEQLILTLREWYMHPNGQMPAYEFAFSDVNPPVHAQACFRVYQLTGGRDRLFLERAFQKLMLNFTWWVNRKDIGGRHVFAGGFLGLDNIGPFDRSQPLPNGALLEQADGTAWMAYYCSTMLVIALELARDDPAYEDIASKFLVHFVAIADAMNTLGGTGLWDEDDGFYYDQLACDGNMIAVRLRSYVGLVPLLAVQVIEDEEISRLPGFAKRMQWFLDNRPDLARQISCMSTGEMHSRRLLAIPSRDRLTRVLRYMLDENEFLSPCGIRSVSRFYRDRPFIFDSDGHGYRVEYEPGESQTGLFGGNSNWRGPVWFPLNIVTIYALERYHHFYGDTLKVEFPTGSGTMMNLRQVAWELARRLVRIFLPDESGCRPCHGQDRRFADDPNWRDLLLFNEYFHGETGKGLGASHQGWTYLVAACLDELAGQRRAQTSDGPKRRR